MDDDDAYPEPPRLRHLRWLVNTLTATLILGFIVIVAVLVIRIAALPDPIPLPEEVALPEGERAQAVTLGADWIAVVTRDAQGAERIRVLDRATGAERTMVPVVAAP